MKARYIYGVVGASETGLQASDGVYPVPYRDISAVVSYAPFVDYASLPKDQVLRYLLEHQQVIEKVMDSRTIIPMKLGTYASNSEEVEHILARGYANFKEVLRKIEAKIELDIVATWGNLQSMLQEIGRGPEIEDLKKDLISESEALSLEAKITIGRRVKELLDVKRREAGLEIERTLGEWAIGFKGHDLMDDRMIFNGAYLLDRNNKDRFELALDQLNQKYDEKIDFRSVGPLPPYSFYTIEVKRLRFEDIEWASRKLGLTGDVVSRKEIEKAYKDQALICHPDKNPGVVDSGKEFQEVRVAYNLLLEYCQGDECSLRREDFANSALIVKV